MSRPYVIDVDPPARPGDPARPVTAKLDGEPEPARCGGWGDMSWTTDKS